MKAWKIFNGYWFLHAYIFMMCIVPFIDIAFEKLHKEMIKLALPILAVVYGWGFAPSLPILRDLSIPLTSGLEGYSGITLLGAYVGAKVYRELDLDRRIPLRWVIVMVPVLFVFSSVGLCEYNSPIALLLSAALFFLFSRIRLPSWMSRIVLIVSPSVFAIYLLHQPNIGLETGAIKQWVDGGGNIYVAYFIFAFIAFGLSIVADVPRRLVACFFKRQLKWTYGRVDAIYDRIATLIMR